MVRQHLLGEREPTTDLMGWNADATRLPPPLPELGPADNNGAGWPRRVTRKCASQVYRLADLADDDGTDDELDLNADSLQQATDWGEISW